MRIHEPIPADELKKAKNYVALRLPREFETTQRPGDLDVAAMCTACRTTSTRRTPIASSAVTPGGFQNVWPTRDILPEKLAVVVVGDRKTIESGIRALNLVPLTVIEPAEILK